MLNHPSLTELLPSGVFIVNDDYNNRMAAIDPATGALVWQYGRHRQEGPRAGQTAHTRRLRPAVAKRIDANTPHNRMKIRVRGQRQTSALRRAQLETFAAISRPLSGAPCMNAPLRTPAPRGPGPRPGPGDRHLRAALNYHQKHPIVHGCTSASPNTPRRRT
jgi:hypothetical protein